MSICFIALCLFLKLQQTIIFWDFFITYMLETYVHGSWKSGNCSVFYSSTILRMLVTKTTDAGLGLNHDI